MRTTRLAIVGLGNVGRRLLELMDLKRALLRERFDLELVVAGAVDTTGGAIATAPRGLDTAEILRLKRGKQGIAAYAELGKPGMTPQQLVSAVDADVLVELSLTDLKDGEPGLSTIRAALARKQNVVTANKGPLVLAFQELMALARANGVRVLYSATVTGGLPTLNIGTRTRRRSSTRRTSGWRKPIPRSTWMAGTRQTNWSSSRTRCCIIRRR
jgi:homoserine dehydrogenase